LNRIVLIGAEPDYPSTNFGYIERGELVEDQTFTYKVKSFKEKPDFETAKSYIRAGNYLWNCGYFVGSIATFIKSIKKQSNELYKNFIKLSSAKAGTYDELYKSLRNETIDYALIEKLDNLLVVPASFDWMDIGSFNDLSNALGGDELGNNIQGNVVTEDVDNSLIQNHENKPLAVIGLDNVVVVNTKDGLIVLRKDLAIKVKEITNRISK
jgi:mannose-1-phosphate guanylyltransferase